MKKIFFFFLSFIIGIFLIISDIHGKEKKVSWPVIQSFKTSYHFIDHENMVFKYQIVSLKGKPLYQMECYLNAYEHEDKDDDFNYSGYFECRLISLKDKYEYPTILTEEKYPTRDWESRGRFLIEELTGKCAEYPEYGKIRHFRLRGMELTLEIKNFKMDIGSKSKNAPWNVDRIKELEFELTGISDPTIISKITEPPKYFEPPRLHPENNDDFSLNCEKILPTPPNYKKTYYKPSWY